MQEGVQDGEPVAADRAVLLARLAAAQAKGTAQTKAAAEAFAAKVLPLIRSAQAEGKSLRQIAETLNT